MLTRHASGILTHQCRLGGTDMGPTAAAYRRTWPACCHRVLRGGSLRSQGRTATDGALWESIWGSPRKATPDLSARSCAAASRLHRRRASTALPASGDVQPATSEGFLLRRIAGDGRCLFRALVQGAHMIRTGEQTSPRDEMELADELRAMVCAAMLEQREDMEPFIDTPFEEYVEDMSEPETWGGEPELAIAAVVLGLPIVVYQQEKGSSDLNETTTYGADFGEEGEPPVSVLFDGVGHYDLLVDADPSGTRPAMPLRPLPKL